MANQWSASSMLIFNIDFTVLKLHRNFKAFKLQFLT